MSIAFSSMHYRGCLPAGTIATAEATADGDTLRLMQTWEPGTPGVLCLPSGRLIRGRGLSRPLPPGPTPQFALYLQARPPAPVTWAARWIAWPDFRLPRDPSDAADALREAWRRADEERVEIACSGGRGRTGTALACVAVLDGIPHDQAVAFVRQHYDSRAVETPWQHRYVREFSVD